MLKGGLRGTLSRIAVGFSFLGLSFSISTILNPINSSLAIPQTAEQTVSTYTMSMSNDSEVDISISPTSEQTIYSATNDISVLNSCPAGATITLSMAGESNALIHLADDSYKFLATTSDSLSDNTWGVSFDNGTTWNAVPIISETALKVYEKESQEDTTFVVPVLYGAKTNSSAVSGSYVNDVIYTMTPNANCLTYSISWDFAGANVSSDYPNLMNQNGTINFSVLPKPTRAYYRFAGFTNGTQVFTGDETEANINPNNETSITIEAIWAPEPYTITYNLNGGSSVSNPTTYDVETETFTLINPTRTGYNFAGWTGSNGTTAQTSVSVAKGSNGNKTFTANWTAVNYSISYTMNGGACSSYTNSYTIETNNFSLCTPTRNGYTFAGWTGSNGTTRQTSVSIPKGSTGNKSYTANWTPTNYTISYTLNGGSVSGNPTSYNIETATFTLKNPTRSGMNFAGWTGSNGTTKQTTVSIAKGSTGNKSYTANWSPVTTVNNYSYTGGIQTYTVPVTGTYKLEVWGAQGGSVSGAAGGYGGYAVGNKSLTAGQVLYIGVGGQNASFNGGSGNYGLGGSDNYSAGGGGGTHIGLSNAQISATPKANLLIVAGGGGGGIWTVYGGDTSRKYYGTGGAGGGNSGVDGTSTGVQGGYSYVPGRGGTQSAGGAQSYWASNSQCQPIRLPGYGLGGIGHASCWQGVGGGGGGGYYGGGAGYNGGGGGGSGYIGGVTGGSMSNGQRSGNGYARITWLN